MREVPSMAGWAEAVVGIIGGAMVVRRHRNG